MRRPLRRALSTGTTPDHVLASSVLDDRPESGVRKPAERFASKPTRDSDGRKSIDEGPGRKFSPVRFLDWGYPKKDTTAMAWPSSSPTELVQLGHSSPELGTLEHLERRRPEGCASCDWSFHTVSNSRESNVSGYRAAAYTESTSLLLVCSVTKDSRRHLLSTASATRWVRVCPVPQPFRHHPTQHGVESGRLLSGGITSREIATSPRHQAPSPFLFPRQSLAN